MIDSNLGNGTSASREIRECTQTTHILLVGGDTYEMNGSLVRWFWMDD